MALKPIHPPCQLVPGHNGQGVKLTTCLHLVRRLRMSGVIRTCLHDEDREHFTFYLFYSDTNVAPTSHFYSQAVLVLAAVSTEQAPRRYHFESRPDYRKG